MKIIVLIFVVLLELSKCDVKVKRKKHFLRKIRLKALWKRNEKVLATTF